MSQTTANHKPIDTTTLEPVQLKGPVSISIRRTGHRLLADARRVLLQPYWADRTPGPDGHSRESRLVERLAGLTEPTVHDELEATLRRFAHRHRDFELQLANRAADVLSRCNPPSEFSRERRLLLGATMSMEYAVEAAALFNPSIVPHPDQSGAPADSARFVMSVRAVGEGHISSIGFRTGLINADGELSFDPLTPYVSTGQIRPAIYMKTMYAAKLSELHAMNQHAWNILESLPEQFSRERLEQAIGEHRPQIEDEAACFEVERVMRWLADSNYRVEFDHQSPLCERILFPSGPTESKGIEDARFTSFVDDEGRSTYFATYTAYDGFQIMPQIITTDDFASFRISTLNGEASQNKGLALFPRKVNGKYVMLSRNDGVRIFIMTSDNLWIWSEAQPLQAPAEAHELVQMGNCGSPIETDRGWLVLTHAVGPLRRYTLGATLLDLNDPSRVIGRLRQPLMEPDENEREGYVPNVLYTCGAMAFRNKLVIPFAYSDAGISAATLDIDGLVDALLHAGP